MNQAPGFVNWHSKISSDFALPLAPSARCATASSSLVMASWWQG